MTLLCLPGAASALDLQVLPQDIRITARDDGGYDLRIRRKPDIACVLLTETTRDPAMKADNYAYRAVEYNEVNGPEKRILKGKLIPPASRLYSLISSTPTADPELGRSLRILIPPVLVYGYSWSRSGAVAVGKGTYINIRAFQLPYGDYRGAFMDNPYEISITAREPERPAPPPEPPPAPPVPEGYSPDAARDLAAAATGRSALVPKDGSTAEQIGSLLDGRKGRSLDLVLCLDTTGSMTPYIDDLKKKLTPIVRERVEGFTTFRVGLMIYKDYWPDEYITRKAPFTADLDRLDRLIKSITTYGGGDIPEAVYEALYAAAAEYDWSADVRLIILVGDAPPHPVPRGKITLRDVAREAAARGIEIDALVEPIGPGSNR
jgi:hypothetical protein